MAKRNTMNDEDRRQWINNDEGLYDWFRRSRLPLRRFIRENRAEIDAAIRPVVDGSKPSHHLKYGG